MDVLEQRKHEAILFTFKQVRLLYKAVASFGTLFHPTRPKRHFMISFTLKKDFQTESLLNLFFFLKCTFSWNLGLSCILGLHPRDATDMLL